MSFVCAQESADERWRPILGVEAILISVISMLGEPNDSSPANIDAGVGLFLVAFGGVRLFMAVKGRSVRHHLMVLNYCVLFLFDLFADRSRLAFSR